MPRTIVKTLSVLLIFMLGSACVRVKVRPPDILIITERTASRVQIIDTSGSTPRVLERVPGDSVRSGQHQAALLRWNLSDVGGMAADGRGRLQLVCLARGDSLALWEWPGAIPDSDEALAARWPAARERPLLAEGVLTEEDGRDYIVFEISTVAMQSLIDRRTGGLVLVAEGEWDLGLVGGFAPLSFAVRPGCKSR